MTAVPAPPGSSDEAVAWHHGDPPAEQRSAVRSAVVVDRSHRDVLVVPGEERLSWLHSITTQHLTALADGDATEALVLDANGRVEHHMALAEAGGQVWLDTEPGQGAALLTYLERMRFWAKAEPAAAELAVLTVLGPSAAAVLTAAGLPVPADGHAAVTGPVSGGPVSGGPVSGEAASGGAASGEAASGVAASGGAADAASGGRVLVRRLDWRTTPAVDVLVPRAELATWWARLTAAGARPAGTLAYEALRVEALRPRLGMDTDQRTIPHEVGWIGGAVHLDKGCYRGQETVARVANLGRPPRRMLLLHLDGSADALPATGDDVMLDGRVVGRVGTVVQHHELGPVALALVKRNVAPDAALTIGGVAASIDPDSVPPETGEPVGRAALRRLGR